MSDSKKDAGGRPAHEPTDKERKQVAALAGLGIRMEDIALVMGLSPPTLRKYYSHELEVGLITANAKVAESVFKQATDPARPNIAAAIFWLKCRAGWREGGGVPLDDPPGKKEQAARDAVTAQDGTGWEALLPKPRTPRPLQ